MLIEDIGIEELVEMVNKLLLESPTNTVGSVSTKLGLKPSSVKMKVRRGGYFFEKGCRQYIKGSPTKADSSEIKREPTITDIKVKEPVSSPPKVKPLTAGEIVAIRKLLAQAQYKHNTNTDEDTSTIQLEYKYSNDDTITRNIKLSRELNTKLIQLMNNLPKGTRVLDVYNTIFSYYLKEHGLL